MVGVFLAAGLFAGAAAAGVTATMSASYATPTTGMHSAAAELPTFAALPAGRIPVAVVLGASGSVAADVLMPYEVFARSERFAVFTVAATTGPQILSGGLHVAADHTLETAPRPAIVVVPAVTAPTGDVEAPLRNWIDQQAAAGTLVLGVCAGVEVLAAAGILDGRSATGFWSSLGSLRRSYPQVSWQAGQRYVHDGDVVTTAGVTSGVAGALYAVELAVGRNEAERIGGELAFPGWRAGGTTTIPAHRLALSDAPYALNAAFPWGRPTVGIGLVDGVGEVEVAAVAEAYAGTSSAADTVAVGAGPVVTTRHGLRLFTTAVTQAPQLDRLVVPGVDTAPTWAPAGVPVGLPHRVDDGRFAADAVLLDLARDADRATARTTAKFTEYPQAHLRLTGPAWPWRATGWALATLLASVAAGVATPLLAGRWLGRPRYTYRGRCISRRGRAGRR
ncbi:MULTISPECIES: DJ-1/PfpI family protein [unclassified Solwaraspora]|uniref:DJ-1/PfpI family protein n=1 Tax=unclassified Solwaraspora TaxID=2627926 RepID=UPI00259B86F4|nr:DJ-1/PfpI family protein [Solwaraspora sp. WMMA2056]WJK38938.1 DJ-1/PfpI family protein [Solwaraspora sp. WMMA2056]